MNKDTNNNDLEVSLSIIVPAYNEEDMIAQAVEHLLKTGPKWTDEIEVIIVNDGSADSTGEIIDNLATRDDRVTAIHLESNSGFGKAVRTGMENARNNYVMVCPADYRFTLEDFNVYLVLIKYADIVIGYRRHRRMVLPLYSKLISSIYHMLVNFLFKLNFFDVNWIHMYRRDKVASFIGKSDGVFLLAESIIRAERLGLRIVGVDVNFTERESGVPTGTQPKTIIKTIRELFRFYYSGNRK